MGVVRRPAAAWRSIASKPSTIEAEGRSLVSSAAELGRGRSMGGAGVEDLRVEGAEEVEGVATGASAVGKSTWKRTSSSEGTGTRSLRCEAPLPSSLRVLRLGDPSTSLAFETAGGGGEREAVRTLEEEEASGYLIKNAIWSCKQELISETVPTSIFKGPTSERTRVGCTVLDGRPVSAFAGDFSSDLDLLRLSLRRVASAPSPSGGPSSLSLVKRAKKGRSRSGERKLS